MSRRQRFLWAGLLGGVAAVLALAMLPPFVPEAWRPVLRAMFAPACHQIPARSPEIGGVTVAVCDRCTGIYAGVVAGVAVTILLRPVWQRIGEAGRYVLLGSLVPLGIDWIAPVAGLWTNTPVTRAATGTLFGLVAASYVTHSLLRTAGGSKTGREENKI